jgi:hypothetical protein
VAHCRFLKRTVDGRSWNENSCARTCCRTKTSAKMATLGKARLIIDQNGDGLWRGEDRMV